MNIRSKLITLLLIIGLIPTLAVGTVSYITISRELNDNTANQLASTAIKQEQKVNALLQTKQEEVSKLTNQYDFQVALGQYLTTESDADRNTLVKIIQSKKINVPEIQAITVADLHDSVLASTLEGIVDQKIDTGGVVNSDKDTVVTVKEDERDGINKLYITTKVSVNKKESAVMSVIFRIDDIVAAVQDYTGLGTTGETVVVEKDSQGNAISLLPLRFDTDAALHTNLNSLHIFDNVNGSAYTEAHDYRNHSVIIVSRSIGFADWVMATKIDSAEALAPTVQLQNALIGIALASSLVIFFVAIYFARFFTGPILRIAKTSKQIGQGDFSAHIDLKRSDEIGALGDSINAMGLSLKEFVQHIESQRNRLQVILDSTEEGIVAVDATGVVRTANRATMNLTGLPMERLVGRRLKDIFRWTRELLPFDVNYEKPGTNNYDDLQYVDPSGLTHYVKMSVTRVGDTQTTKGVQTIITIYDETKSRDLENMKIDFVSMAAHELRTPLAAIRGYLELISYKEKQSVTPDVQKYLLQAIKSTSELGSLINNLLDVTRIERGTLALNMGKVDLATNIVQSVEDAKFSAQDKQIQLNYNGPKTGYMVFADEIALHEVINNLISNAVKYTNKNGSVTITVSQQGQSYSISVQDTGMGIPKSAIGNLFTKFYRVHGGLNSGSTGTGLGLFIAKSIIERHNGTISVASQEGVGSTFTFTLPVLTADASGAAPASDTSPETENTRRKRGWITKNIAR